MEQFKGNSINSKEPEIEKEKISLTSTVTVKKQSEFSKLKNQLISEDAKTVGSHILSEVIIPSFQKLLSDMVKNGIDWLIYGVGNKRPNTVNSVGIFGGFGSSSVQYTKYYEQKPQQSPQKMSMYNINEVIFDNKGDAESVLFNLSTWVGRYGRVSVGDFYDLVHLPYNFTDEKYGWKDLSTAEVVRNSGKYSINFPRPIVL